MTVSKSHLLMRTITVLWVRALVTTEMDRLIAFVSGGMATKGDGLRRLDPRPSKWSLMNLPPLH
ncbi:MAG: hypothetical protein CMJ84_12580 [Planctomycetes bacterium]|nr:hypothetical protein [Planctomycetota bacterium]